MDAISLASAEGSAEFTREAELDDVGAEEGSTGDPAGGAPIDGE